MAARILVASCALLAFFHVACAQDIAVQVYHQPTQARQALVNSYIDVATQLNSVKSQVEHLYIDFASRMTNNMNSVIKNITNCVESTRRNCHWDYCHTPDNQCWVKFDYHLQKIAHDGRKKAEESAEIHTKYLKGYMVVARIHLDRTAGCLRRYDRFLRGCRLSCQETARVSRFHRIALEKIRRVRNDLPFTKRAYHDLLCRSRQELRQFERYASIQTRRAIEEMRSCVDVRR
nr:uncharacterized protein LOC110382974 [Helicoverpa armigera]